MRLLRISEIRKVKGGGYSWEATWSLRKEAEVTYAFATDQRGNGVWMVEMEGDGTLSRTRCVATPGAEPLEIYSRDMIPLVIERIMRRVRFGDNESITI